MLLNALKRDFLGRVRMPIAEKIAQFNNSFATNYTMLHNVYCVVEGLQLHLEQPGEMFIQNTFFNGWTHNHYFSNFLVFNRNGVVILGAINAPGAMNDSVTAK